MFTSSDGSILEVQEPADRAGYQPFPKQAEFHAIPTSIKEGFFGGAAGPGKSLALLMDPIVRRLHEHPRFHGILFRETYPQLKESLIFESQAWYPLVGGVYNATDHVWKFPSGAEIRFSYLAKDEQAKDHDTAQYNYAAYDELTMFSRYRYMYVVHSRVRTTVKGLPAYARSASNPLGIGHGWVKERFITPSPQGGKIIREVQDNGEVTKRIFISARVTDNPKIMKEDPGYVNSLMLLPEAEKRSKLYGDWDAVAGAVFLEFRTQQMPDEPENALHVIEPFEIPEFWPVVLAVDWGFDAMTWAGFFAISPDERVVLCREKDWYRTKIKVWGAELAQLAALYPNLKTPVLDRSAWNDRGDELTVQEQLEAASGLTFERSDSDRVGGKMLLHDYLRWKPKPPRYIPKEGYSEEVYQLLYRRRGEKASAEYKKLFEPEPPETNLPQLRIFNTCKLAINCIVGAVTDPKNPEDTLEYPGDDPYDGTRYGIKRVHRYFEESKAAHEQFHRRDKIVADLKRTGDMTAFYRQMEMLEDDERMASQPARRYTTYRSGRGRIFGRRSA